MKVHHRALGQMLAVNEHEILKTLNVSQLKCKLKHFHFLQNIDARSDPLPFTQLMVLPPESTRTNGPPADISRWREIWGNCREIKHASRAQCYPTGNFHPRSRINFFNSNLCVNCNLYSIKIHFQIFHMHKFCYWIKIMHEFAKLFVVLIELPCGA